MYATIVKLVPLGIFQYNITLRIGISRFAALEKCLVTNVGAEFSGIVADLLDQMVANKVESVLIKTATLGLDQKHLGMTLGQVRNHLHAMNAKVMSLPPRDHSSIDQKTTDIT